MEKARRPADKTGGSSGRRRTTGRRTTIRVQGGNDGGKSQGGALSRGMMVGPLATARTVLHGGDNGGRNQGVTGIHATMVMEVEPMGQTENRGGGTSIAVGSGRCTIALNADL